jgi:hypothetical protein
MKTKGIVTSKQIDELSNSYGGYLKTPSAINHELSMKRMMISCFIYGSIDRSKYWFERYILPNQEDLSKKVFDEIYEEMSEHLSKCHVNYGVCTDSEGCVYSSISHN